MSQSTPMRATRSSAGSVGRRHRQPAGKEAINNIGRPSLRRLARRGGVVRLSGTVYDTMRGVLRGYLEAVIGDASTMAEHARRKTITIMDVTYALKRVGGMTLYGYDGDHPRRRPVGGPAPSPPSPAPCFARMVTSANWGGAAVPPPPRVALAAAPAPEVSLPALRAAWAPYRDLPRGLGPEAALAVSPAQGGGDAPQPLAVAPLVGMLRDTKVLLWNAAADGAREGGRPWPLGGTTAGDVVLVGPVAPLTPRGSSRPAAPALYAAVASCATEDGLRHAMVALLDQGAGWVVVSLEDVPAAEVEAAALRVPWDEEAAAVGGARLVLTSRRGGEGPAEAEQRRRLLSALGLPVVMYTGVDPLQVAEALVQGAAATGCRVGLVVPVLGTALERATDILAGTSAAAWAARTSVVLWTTEGHPQLFADPAYRVEQEE